MYNDPNDNKKESWGLYQQFAWLEEKAAAKVRGQIWDCLYAQNDP